jgi:hypothetical protein
MNAGEAQDVRHYTGSLPCLVCDGFGAMEDGTAGTCGHDQPADVDTLVLRLVEHCAVLKDQAAQMARAAVVEALREAADQLVIERDALREKRHGYTWPRGVEDAARTVRSLADGIKSGEVPLP